jgi:bacillithiol biosynthesis cysteine-adding enzyme BshC
MTMTDHMVQALDYRVTPLRDSLYAILNEDRQSLQKWLGITGWNTEGLVAAARRQVFTPRVMADLRRQNQDSDPAVAQALAMAEAGRSVFVITGQQAGILGGPLYTVYKAITVLRLVDELRRQDIPAVGLFWVAGEDHDLAEVSSVTVSGPGGAGRTFSIDPSGHEMQPVSRIPLGEEVAGMLEEIRRLLPDTPSGREVAAQLTAGVDARMTFGESFRALMQSWFARFGLLFFDPMAADRRAMMADFLRPLADLREEIMARVQASTRRLTESGWPAPVDLQPDRCCLFYLHPELGRRRVLARSEGGFTVDGTEIAWDEGGLREALHQSPERFSPDVLLRPLLQDFIFPTAAYVGGPAEMAYQLQVRELYPLWDIPAPVIWPRATATVFGPALVRRLEKLNLAAERIFDDRTTLIRSILESFGIDRQVEPFREKYSEVEASLAALLSSVQHFPEPMIRSAESTVGKMRGLLEKLDDRVQRQLKKDNDDLVNGLESLLQEARPSGRMQERVFNVISFLMYAGPRLMDTLLEELDPFQVAHFLIQVSDWESVG